MMRPFPTFPALATAGFFMAACASPATNTGQPSPPAVANADVCRDQWGFPAPRFEWRAWLAVFVRTNGGGLEWRTMADDERLRFLSAYNNTPPVTDRNADRVEVFSRPNYPFVVVAFVKDGCVTLSPRVPRALVESVMSPTVGKRRSLRLEEREA